MNLTDIFIKKPVLAVVVSLLIVLAGLQSLSDLSVRQFPRSDIARIDITTAYIGANAELVKGFVTTPIERAIASASGIDYVTSTSFMGLSTVSAHLKLNYDPLKAMTEISAKVNQVRGELPKEAEVPAITINAADSEFAQAYLSFTSDMLGQNQITEFLSRSVQPRLIAVSGVQKVDILGGRTFAMRIWLDSEKMMHFGITPSQVHHALSSNNVQATLGSTQGSFTQVNLTANAGLSSVEEFKQITLKQTQKGVVKLQDIAKVELGADNYNTDVFYSGQTAVFMGVFVAPNANSLDVMKNVRAEMALIQKELPSGLDAHVSYDSTEYIDAAIKDVIKTLAETLLIIIVVIFLFLGFSRSVLIPIVAIPLSLIGALFIMQVFGFSLNLLTLLSIVLAVGLVVDDAIVMVENIERHIQEGLKPMRAALVAGRELCGPIIAMTVTLISVYVPIGLQGGLTGTLFREFTITLAGAVVMSSIVALTLSPMMAAKMLKPHKKIKAPLEGLFERFSAWYARRLLGTLRNRPGIYLFWIVIAMLTVPMYMMSAKELAPTEDQGVIFGIVDAPSSATIDQASFYGQQANQAFMSIPETDFTFQITFPNGGFGGMVTKPWDERERTTLEIVPELQAKLNEVAGIRIVPITPAALPGGGNFPVEFVISSTAESKEIFDYAQKLQATFSSSGYFAFPPLIDMKLDQPEYKLDIDREKVADLGLTMADVTRDLAILLGGGWVNRFNMDGLSYKVIPQVKRSQRLTPDDLEKLYITGPNNTMIRLDQVATLTHETVPRSINRMQQLNAVKLSGVAIKPLGETLNYIEQEAKQLLPSDYMIDYTGESRQLKREGGTFLPAFITALAMIFLVLAAQYNSFRDPVVILVGSVPLAMFGALIFTFLKIPAPMPHYTDAFTSTLNIYSQVGLVTLVGLIARNGILVVEFANRLQQEGMAKIEAVTKASVLRLRPVMMTSFATVAGHAPLIFAEGAGAAARNSIGIVLVLGMTIGTIMTLFVLPSIYVLFAKDHNKVASQAKAQLA